MFARLRRRMNRQPQGQEQDFEFCTCDVCIRELRRAAEKEALEAAAKQQLMVSLSNLIHRALPHPFSSISLGPFHQMGGAQGNGSKT
jgi:hypothetical protein